MRLPGMRVPSFISKSSKLMRIGAATVVLTAASLTITSVVRAETTMHTVTGQVRFSDGTVLRRADVSLSGNNSTWVRSDENGYFSIAASEGVYKLKVAWTHQFGVPAMPNGPQEINLTGDEIHVTGDTDQNFVIPIVNFTIRTVDGAGNPAPNVPVSLRMNSHPNQYFGPDQSIWPTWTGRYDNHSVVSDANGAVMFKVLKGSAYNCIFDSYIAAAFSAGSSYICGNESPFISADASLTVKQGTPSSPVYTYPYSSSHTNTPAIRWDANYSTMPVDHYEIYRDGVAIGTTTALYFADVNAPEGEHTYTVAAVGPNEAKNGTNYGTSIISDKTPPMVSNALLSVSEVVQDGALQLSARLAEPAVAAWGGFMNSGVRKVEYFVDTDPGRGMATDVPVSSSISREPFDISERISTDLSPGQHTLYLRAVDDSGNHALSIDGNWSETVALPFTVKPVPVPQLTATRTITNWGADLKWTVTTPVDHFEVYRNGVRISSLSNTHYTDTTISAEGTYSYSIKSVSSAGRLSERSNVVDVTLDRTPPTLGTHTWSTNPMLHSDDPAAPDTVLSVTAQDDRTDGLDRVEYLLDGGERQTMQFDAASATWRATIPSTLPVNTYTVEVYAVDAAGSYSQPIVDVLAVHGTGSGRVSGHANIAPTENDVLPIALDTSNKPAEVKLGFTNVIAGQNGAATGSFDLQYVVRNNRDEFSLSSTGIDWVVVPASGANTMVQGKAVLTKYVNGQRSDTQNVTVRIEVRAGTDGGPDHITVKIYAPSIDPATSVPTWTIDNDVAGNSQIRIVP